MFAEPEVVIWNSTEAGVNPPPRLPGGGGEPGILNCPSLSPTASSIHPVCTASIDAAALHPTATVRDTAAIDTAIVTTTGTRWMGCVPHPALLDLGHDLTVS